MKVVLRVLIMVVVLGLVVALNAGVMKYAYSSAGVSKPKKKAPIVERYHPRYFFFYYGGFHHGGSSLKGVGKMGHK